jgi:hypothetical protein
VMLDHLDAEARTTPPPQAVTGAVLEGADA